MRRPLPLFFSVYVILTLARACSHPLWFDELFTYYIGSLPTVKNLWVATTSGADLNPPLHYLLVRAFMAVFGHVDLAARLPSILAYGLGCCCLFLFVSRRCASSQAWTALLFPLVSPSYYYAQEARPYAIVFFGCCAAFLFWQRSTEEKPRLGYLTGLSLSLGLALLSQCYAVLLYLPLAAGEVVRTVQKRAIDKAVWCALLLPSVATISYLPFYRASRGFALHTYAVPSLHRLSASALGILDGWGLLALIAAFAFGRFAGGSSSRTKLWARVVLAVPSHELAAAFLLACLPVFAFLLARTVTGFYEFRYAMPCVAGWAILFAFFLMGRTSTTWFLAWMPTAIMACFVCISIGTTIGTAIEAGNPFTEGALEGCHPENSELPIVVASGLEYLPMAHYGPVNQRGRYVYLADPESAARFTGNWSVDMGLSSLGRFAPLNVRAYRDFITETPTFLVYGSRGQTLSWLFQKLDADAARIEELTGCDCSKRKTPLYRVSVRPAS